MRDWIGLDWIHLGKNRETGNELVQKTKTHVGLSVRRGKTEKFVSCNEILVYWMGKFCYFMWEHCSMRKEGKKQSGQLQRPLNFEF